MILPRSNPSAEKSDWPPHTQQSAQYLQELEQSKAGAHHQGQGGPAPVAVAVHLQDVDVVGEAVEQCSGQAFRPETSVHSSKGRLVVARMDPRS